MFYSNKESGQALLGGLIFLIFVSICSFYFISTAQSLGRLYHESLANKFEITKNASKYANILNEISLNNQNILISVMTAQAAYIKSVENGLSISYKQPYWQTYKELKDQSKSGLSEQSSNVVKSKFNVRKLDSAKGFFVARALADRNQKLIDQLPISDQNFFTRSTKDEINCISLEFLPSELHKISKNFCKLKHQSTLFQSLFKTGLSVLAPSATDLIIDFNKMDEYAGFMSNFNYGVTYVKTEFADKFMQNLMFQTKENQPLSAVARITHPFFECQTHSKKGGDFIIESDFKNYCAISKEKFLKSFFNPSWSALITKQSIGFKK